MDQYKILKELHLIILKLHILTLEDFLALMKINHI